MSAKSKVSVAIGMVVSFSALAPSAFGQTAISEALKDLPTWKIPDICAKDSAPGHCLVLESEAWRTVSGGWVSVPDAARKKCLTDFKTPADYSWRALNDCIDVEMERIGDQRAVATRVTPSEPVPPPKPAAVQGDTSASAGVPPPILGFSAAPPPFALEAEIAARKAAEEAEAKRKAESDDAAKRAAEETEARRKAEAEAAARRAAEEAEARRKAETEAAARRAAEEAEARRKAEAEAAARRAAEEAEARRLAAARQCQDSLQSIAKAGGIRFRFGKSDLDPQSQPTLNKIADAAKGCPNVLIKVDGHTDAVGDKDVNQALSLARAEAVAEFLVAAGLPRDRVVATGYGMDRPLADNATVEGRAQNRRIEFVVEPKN
jgi:outer membrane protein OmpA-like peptidoglycan-associated protein